MSIERARAYLKEFGMEERIMELAESSATVELAAEALHCEPERIAKTLSFLVGEQPILIVAAGDARIDNHKYKTTFGTKAKMIPAAAVEDYIGHAVGGVCPFGIKKGIKVYLDESLKQFETVFPACGSGNSAIELTIPGTGAVLPIFGMGKCLQGGVIAMTQLLLAIIYLAFISLGLPDSLLGSAWPTMYIQFGVPISYAGIISMIIAGGTIISSLQSDRLTKWLGTGKVTAISVATTAVALLGFSFTHSFWALCLWAIPYGLGAGSVDASLNNYVALHYKSRHMSWLHCMWGVGATAGPYIMGIALSAGHGWNMGYRYIGVIQMILTAALIFSLPLWKGRTEEAEVEELQTDPAENGKKVLSVREILKISGAREVMLCFFCYCALEQTTGLWASSYLNLHKGIPAETAAAFASLFFIGITVGRAISGFVTMKLNDIQMIRLGQGIIVAGIVAMILPGSNILAMAGLILIGLGCAPIYPCVIHSTPAHFGADKSQAIIGVQMAFAYIGTMLMPPLFGMIARGISVALLPFYLFAILVVMIIMHELLTKKTA